MQLKVIHVCRPLVPKKSYIDFDILINYFLSINTIEWFHRRRSSNMWISARPGLTVPLRQLIRAATRPDDTIILKTGGSSLDSAGPCLYAMGFRKLHFLWVSRNKKGFFRRTFLYAYIFAGTVRYTKAISAWTWCTFPCIVKIVQNIIILIKQSVIGFHVR